MWELQKMFISTDVFKQNLANILNELSVESTGNNNIPDICYTVESPS